MRWSPPLALALVSACGASEVQSQKLKDGSWSFQCELSMDECIRRAQEKCPNQRYRILEGTSETRLRDAPPFERAYHTSRLRLTCTNDGAEPLITLGGDAKVPAAASASPTAPAPRSPVCSPGQTRECVGPGACKGGQVCLSDGGGFAACDCGPSVLPPEGNAAPAPSASSVPVAPAAP
jgi:hypothetical protein